MRPQSLEGDWNRLYNEFPEIYDAWTAVRHEPRPIDVIAATWALAGTTIVDVGSGTGSSTFDLAAYAAEVVGVEPNAAMRRLAERRAAAGGIGNVSFAEGSASALPCRDGSVDVVACITTSFWPAQEVVPAFVSEAERVLRPSGCIIVLNTPPGWYGGELHDLLEGSPAYEQALETLFAEAGFEHFDFDTVQEYGTPDRAAETYGFIFGSRAIAELRARRQSRIRWRWRIRHRGR